MRHNMLLLPIAILLAAGASSTAAIAIQPRHDDDGSGDGESFVTNPYPGTAIIIDDRETVFDDATTIASEVTPTLRRATSSVAAPLDDPVGGRDGVTTSRQDAVGTTNVETAAVGSDRSLSDSAARDRSPSPDATTATPVYAHGAAIANGTASLPEVTSTAATTSRSPSSETVTGTDAVAGGEFASSSPPSVSSAARVQDGSTGTSAGISTSDGQQQVTVAATDSTRQAETSYASPDVPLSTTGIASPTTTKPHYSPCDQYVNAADRDRAIARDLTRLMSQQLSTVSDYCEAGSYAQLAGTIASSLALFVSFIVTMCQLQRLLRNQRLLLKAIEGPQTRSKPFAPICNHRPVVAATSDNESGASSSSMPLLQRSSRSIRRSPSPSRSSFASANRRIVK